MWHLTQRKNGELVETKSFEFVDIKKAVGLYKAIGYEEDTFFTVPEWNRYCLIRQDDYDYLEVFLEED